jgi:beta-1,4-N-acetylglucosaminyltransferase
MLGLNYMRKILNKKSIMITLGSGGHTGELLLMIKNLKLEKFAKVYFVISHNDTASENKLYENIDYKNNKNKIELMKIYRSRNVGQTFKSSILTTIISFFHSVILIIKARPNMVICI